MIGTIPPLPQYALMACCSAKAQGTTLLLLYFCTSPAFMEMCIWTL